MKHFYILLSVFVCCFGFDRTIFSQSWTQTAAVNTNWSSIAASADGAIFYASGGTTNHHALYLSTNSGSIWTSLPTPTTNFLYSLCTSADGTKVFLASILPPATPPTTTNYAPLFLSTNSGASWNSIGDPTSNVVSSLAISADGNTLMAGMSSRNLRTNLVYISTNSGISWRVVQIGYSNPRVSLTSAGTMMFVLAGFTPNVLLLTTNAGILWITNNLPASNYSWNTLVSSADGQSLAALGEKFSVGTYVCTSTNAGMSWVTNTVSASQYTASFGMVASADGNQLILAAGGLIFRSTNFAASWQMMNSPATNWLHLAGSADGSKVAATAGQTVSTIYGVGGIWTFNTVPRPVLNLNYFSTNVLLSWIVPATNFSLQANANLVTTNWSTLTNTPLLNFTGLKNEIILPALENTMFYRLATP